MKKKLWKHIFHGVISRNTPLGAPDHIVSDVLPKIIRCFRPFNIIHFHEGDPASVDQPPACGQEPNSGKKNHKKKKKSMRISNTSGTSTQMCLRAIPFP